MLAVQKTLDDKGKIQATFTDVPEQRKPRGFKPQNNEKGLAKYQEDEI